MENFVVSARKYRPSTFDTVVGQSHITTTLKNAISQNHLAQAFLFCGPRGVGKTTCARILAKTINCQNLTSQIEACNECDSCKSFNNNASFNVHELDAASNNSVDDIRNLVDQVRYPPQYGRYKVYIIDEVHMLSNSAFNAFLKTLEEPPSYAIFILATTEKHKIIPTILSRCQIFDFNRIGTHDIGGHLAQIAQKESIQAQEEALQLIAQKADGGLRDALSMFDLIVTFSTDRSITYQNTIANLHILDYDYYFQMTDALLNENVAKAWLLFDEILKKGFDGHNFIIGLCEHLRNLLVCRDASTVQLLQVSGSVQQKYLDQASKAALSFLVSALNLGAQCDINYKASKNQRLHIELALMKMAHIPAAISLTQLVQNGTADLKKKVDTPVNGKDSIDSQPAVPVTTAAQPGVRENGSSPTRATISVKPTINLSARLAAVPEPTTTTVKEKAQVVEIVETYEETPFTLEQLQAQWQKFAQTRTNATEQVILNRTFKLEGTTIHLTLDNQIQMSQLHELRMDLLPFLRRSVNNGKIQLQAEIGEQEARKVIYTNLDKFKYLAEKHPFLQDLRMQLGLDVDF
jgi:DNA polymerase-3 subunit gamma/tau